MISVHLEGGQGASGCYLSRILEVIYLVFCVISEAVQSADLLPQAVYLAIRILNYASCRHGQDFFKFLKTYVLSAFIFLTYSMYIQD